MSLKNCGLTYVGGASKEQIAAATLAEIARSASKMREASHSQQFPEPPPNLQNNSSSTDIHSRVMSLILVRCTDDVVLPLSICAGADFVESDISHL
eukprot:2180151-Amphidinium_carterae.3